MSILKVFGPTDVTPTLVRNEMDVPGFEVQILQVLAEGPAVHVQTLMNGASAYQSPKTGYISMEALEGRETPKPGVRFVWIIKEKDGLRRTCAYPGRRGLGGRTQDPLVYLECLMFPALTARY